jgi:hypothetical protein
MPVWTIVFLSLTPNAPTPPMPVLIQRHFATALACERSAALMQMPAGLRLVCLPSATEPAVELAAAY